MVNFNSNSLIPQLPFDPFWLECITFESAYTSSITITQLPPLAATHLKQPPQVDPIANAAVRRSQEAFRIQKAAYRHANGGSSAPTLTQDAQVHLSLELNEFDLTTGSQPEKPQPMVHGLPDFGFLCFCVLGSCILNIRYIHRLHRQKKHTYTILQKKRKHPPLLF